MVRLLTLFFLALSVGALKYDMKTNFRSGNMWQYVTKFGVGVENFGEFKFRARLTSPYRPSYTFPGVHLMVMNDKEWDQMTERSSCQDKASLARFNIPLVIPGDGEWTGWGTTGRIEMMYRSQVWFIHLSDCGSETHNRYPDMPDIEVEIEALNNDSHFSQEMMYVPTINLLALATFGYLLGFSGWKYLQELKKDEISQKPLSFLVMALLAEFGSCAANAIHNLVYDYDGYGVWMLD